LGWVWRLHSSQRYTVKSAYNNLTAANVDLNVDGNHVMWLKVIPLKVNIFISCLLLNRIATKNNLFRRNIIVASNIHYLTDCGCLEDKDHFFFNCDFYDRLWNYTSGWLGFILAPQGNLFNHLLQFGGLRGFFHLTFNFIWISVLYTIWKDMNEKIFNQKTNFTSLLEKVKSHSFWW